MIDKFENSNDITREYFNHLLLEQRLMDAEVPNTSVQIFGHRFDTPVMTSSLSHMNEFHKDADHPMENYAKGADIALKLCRKFGCEYILIDGKYDITL